MEVEESIYKPYLLRKAYRYLKNYFVERRCKNEDRAKYELVGKHYIMKRCLSAFQDLLELRRREKFMSKRRNNRIKFECFANLSLHASNNIKS
jgi:hypothetical protein